MLGNGIEWAHTKDPKKAGYLTEPKSRKYKGEWTRKYDLPYGKLKIDLDIEPYIQNDIYELRKIDHERTKKSLIDWASFMEVEEIKNNAYHITEERNYGESKIFQQTLFTADEFDKLPPNTLRIGDKYNESYNYFLALVKKSESSDKRQPYPNFQKQYSCFWEDGSELIQDDWKEAGYEHMKYWQEFYNDEERIKLDFHYPKPENIKSLKEHIEKYYIKEKKKTIEQIAKDNDFPDFDGNNYEALTWYRWNKDVKKTKEFLEETLLKLKK